jgi:hypothetical protein
MGGRGRYSPGTTEQQLLNRWNREANRQLEYRTTKRIINNTKPKEHQPMSLENYEPVAVRLDRWLSTHPGTQVLTELLTEPGADICVFKASLLVDGAIVATGHAEEIRNAGNVNRTSHVENCETSAIGRALANAGAAGSTLESRPSREEMAKVQRVTQQGNTTITGPANAPSDKQLWLYKKLLKDIGKLPPANIAEMDKFEVSRAIEALKAGEQPEEIPLPEEEPF